MIARILCYIDDLKRDFQIWNDLRRTCSKCSGKMEYKITDRIDYTPCEAEYVCSDCNYVGVIWAYGNYDGPITRTEAIGHWWHFTKLRITTFFLRFK